MESVPFSLFQVVSNIFFNGLLSSTAHIVLTLVMILMVTAISLSYDCLGVVLELNVSVKIHNYAIYKTHNS